MQAHTERKAGMKGSRKEGRKEGRQLCNWPKYLNTSYSL